MSEYTSNCVSKEVRNTLDFAISKTELKYRYKKKLKSIVQRFENKKIEEIDWIDICNISEEFKVYKFFLAFLIELLNNNHYVGSYKDELYSLLPYFNKIFNQKTFTTKKIFCKDNICNLLISDWIPGSDINIFIIIDGNNNFIKNEIKKLFTSHESKYIRVSSLEFWEHFTLSFSQYQKTINSIEDFNSNTFFTQIHYYKNLYKNEKDKKKKYRAISSVIMFYRYLVNQYNEYDFFRNSFNMNKKLLFNTFLISMILDDYYFTNYFPNNHPNTKSKVCFLLKGYESHSTKLSNDDFISFDISQVTNSEYRTLIWSYIMSFSKNIGALSKGILSAIIEELKFAIDIKSQPNYPNTNSKYFSNQEAFLIRNHIDSKSLAISSKNNQIGAIRRFFIFCNEQNFINFDDMFFEYLKQFEEPTKNRAKAIPDNELILMNSKLIEHAKTNILWKEMYAIFHIALQTEFRINQILHLKINCIKPSVKPNQFIVFTNSKTSHGAVDSFVITEFTYKFLMDIIDDTENLRDNCNIETYKDYIFLQEGISDSVILITPPKVNDYFRKVCKELNLENYYTSSNLRDTHMTKAFEHILRSGKSDIESSVLSKHKYIDTTQNHYIEMKLEEMLEATYGIIVGEEFIETDSKIVDKIPDEINNKENEVENGCGNCSAKSCQLNSSLPCLACKDFITTINHEVYFKRAIENVNRLIEKATNTHDKEDLITIKKLYILYLKAIYKKKEEIVND